MPARTHRRPVRVMETFRIIFYAPIYVAVAGGFWEGEGLDVTFATCAPPFPHALAALNQDAADIAQSGIMRSIIALDWGAETVPAHIAKINSRDGFFVLARRPQEEFCWESLRGATVIPVGFSPMPWASFQFALRRHGVEPEELRLVPGLALDRAVAAFQGGEGDFIHLPQPAAEQLLGAGQAYLAVALGPVNGHLAYSSFAASSRFLDARPEAARSFVRGFARALRWLSENDAATVGAAVAGFFPGVDTDLVRRAVERYQKQETWCASPMLDQPEYEGLQDILVDAGLVKVRQPYDKVVRTEFAREVAE